MDYTQITAREQIHAALGKLRGLLQTGSQAYVRTIGFQGESLTRTVRWHVRYGFWVIVDSNITENRFWIAFGTEDPSVHGDHSSLSITCETNVPRSGIDRRSGGAFYQKRAGIYLCHNGRIGGGRKGIGKAAFLAWYADRFGLTWPPGIIVGAVSGSKSKLLSDTAKFVLAVEQFKHEIKATGTVDDELDRDADIAKDEGEFAPRGNLANRERALRSINARRGQPAFRNKLLNAYSSRCAMCGYDCLDALEAAHISGYWNEDSNHVQNGLLLRCDLHTLFDLGKIGVDPTNFSIVVSKQLMTTVYGKLSGRRLRLPARRVQWPSCEILRDHLKRWKLQ
jgi:HNH endonuclease